MCFSNGWPDQPEAEREQQDAWEDSDDGDMPWDPNPANKPQPWQTWTVGPEEKMYRDLADEEDDGA